MASTYWEHNLLRNCVIPEQIDRPPFLHRGIPMLRQPQTPAFLFAIACSCLAAFILPAHTAFATDDGSIAAKSDAQLENPAHKVATPSVPEPGDAGSGAVATKAEQKENARELNRRPGEQNAEGQEGKSGVLGMYLQEAPNGGLRVVEVGAGTPAFDAGLHEGDQILSYQGFSADNYRKWIDGIR